MLNLKRNINLGCLFLLSFLFFQCSSEIDKNKEITGLKTTELKIESEKSLSDYRPNITGQLTKFKIIEGLNDIKDYEINYVSFHDAYFIQGRGFDKDGNSVLFRQQIGLKKLKDGTKIIDFNPGKDPIGETCASVNCSKCSFAADGGCDCSQGINQSEPAGCNHTITI